MSALSHSPPHAFVVLLMNSRGGHSLLVITGRLGLFHGGRVLSLVLHGRFVDRVTIFAIGLLVSFVILRLALSSVDGLVFVLFALALLICALLELALDVVVFVPIVFIVLALIIVLIVLALRVLIDCALLFFGLLDVLALLQQRRIIIILDFIRLVLFVLALFFILIVLALPVYVLLVLSFCVSILIGVVNDIAAVGFDFLVVERSVIFALCILSTVGRVGLLPRVIEVLTRSIFIACQSCCSLYGIIANGDHTGEVQGDGSGGQQTGHHVVGSDFRWISAVLLGMGPALK